MTNPWVGGLTMVATALALAGVLGCGAATRGSARADCALAAADSALLRAGPVYTACTVDRPARELQAPVQFPTSAGPRQPSQSCMVAEVQFVVDTDGRPEPGTIRVLRTDDDDWARALVASVPDWTYEPAQRGAQPVRQLVRIKKGLAVVAVRRGELGSLYRDPPANCP